MRLINLITLLKVVFGTKIILETKNNIIWYVVKFREHNIG